MEDNITVTAQWKDLPRHVHEPKLGAELAETMLMTGCKTLEEIGPGAIQTE